MIWSFGKLELKMGREFGSLRRRKEEVRGLRNSVFWIEVFEVSEVFGVFEDGRGGKE